MHIAFTTSLKCMSFTRNIALNFLMQESFNSPRDKLFNQHKAGRDQCKSTKMRKV